MTNAVSPEPGMVVYVNFWGRWRHYGIVSDRYVGNKPTVIANAFATRGVREVPWDQFADGRQVFVAPSPAELAPFLVVYNARQLIDQPYRLFTANCEHFIHKCHGLEPTSHQAALLGVLGFGVAAVVIMNFAAN